MVGKFWEEFNESRAGLIEQNSKAISGAEEIEYELINFVKRKLCGGNRKGRKDFIGRQFNPSRSAFYPQ